MLQITYGSIKDHVFHIYQRKKSVGVESGDVGEQFTGPPFPIDFLQINHVKLRTHLEFLIVFRHRPVRIDHFQKSFVVRFSRGCSITHTNLVFYLFHR